MRKVLAVASVNVEHKELVLKELRKIFRKIEIPLEELISEEPIPSQDISRLFDSYPYITLYIPNYEQHRQYLEKMYKSTVLFSKFLLLISEGNTDEQLIQNRSEDVLMEQCRNWNDQVQCQFESNNPTDSLEDQLQRINDLLGGMDIRGKINQIIAQKKFYLIEHHPAEEPASPISMLEAESSQMEENYDSCEEDTSVFVARKLFFGLEIARGRRGKVAKEEMEGVSRRKVAPSWQNMRRLLNEQKEAKDRPLRNPYLKKSYADEAMASIS